jgi:putative tryptophan/tyrosine transport system substrate-binding protein
MDKDDERCNVLSLINYNFAASQLCGLLAVIGNNRLHFIFSTLACYYDVSLLDSWSKLITVVRNMKKQVVRFLTIALFFGSLASIHAQPTPKSLPRIGFIYSTGAPGASSLHSILFDSFQGSLNKLGYVEGKNVLIERRYAEGRLDRMPALVNELVQEKVDVILAVNNVVIRAAKEASKTIPIVMLSTVDPIAAGYVQSFAQPRGNITGLAWLSRDLSAKRLEILKELLPRLSRVGILWDEDGPGPAVAFKEYSTAALGFKLDLRSLPVKGPNPDLNAAFQNAKKSSVDGIIIVANPLIGQRTKEIFELATKNRIPSMTEEGRFVEAGGLISYGANLADLYSRAAEYVVEILKGVKPGDLPVKLASRFEIFVNLKTSQQLGIVVPQHILIQADKVIK